LTLSEIDQFAEVDNLPNLVKTSNLLSLKLLDRWRCGVAQIIQGALQLATSTGFLLDFTEEKYNVVNSLLNKIKLNNVALNRIMELA